MLVTFGVEFAADQLVKVNVTVLVSGNDISFSTLSFAIVVSFTFIVFAYSPVALSKTMYNVLMVPPVAVSIIVPCWLLVDK